MGLASGSFIKNNIKKGLKPVIKLDGYARLDSGGRLIILGKGMVSSRFWSQSGQEAPAQLPVTKDIKRAAPAAADNLPTGNLRIQGVMQFTELHRGRWVLDICTVDDRGMVRSAFGRGILWAREAGIERSGFILGLMALASYLISGGILALLGVWALWCVVDLLRGKALEERNLVAISVAWFSQWLLVELGAQQIMVMERSLAWGLGIYALLLFCPWPRLRLDPKKTAFTVLLIVGPRMLTHYSQAWWAGMGRFRIFEDGQDWLIYQAFARKISLTMDSLQSHRLILYKPAPAPLFCDPEPLYSFGNQSGHGFSRCMVCDCFGLSVALAGFAYEGLRIPWPLVLRRYICNMI